MSIKTKIDVYITFNHRKGQYDWGVLNKETKKVNWRSSAHYDLDRTKEIIENELGKFHDITYTVS
jgi:hypothetical protein